MMSARDNILARVREAVAPGASRDRGIAAAAAESYVAAHSRGPSPEIVGDIAECFVARARDLESTVEAIQRREDVPAAVASYLGSNAGTRMPGHASRGVCWPEFADLDWRGAGLEIEPRPTVGDDLLGITGAFCAIAETGTLVVMSSASTPTASALLPETHIAIVSRSRIVATMEDAFALIRTERPATPRAVNLISGPSRTGDIEQTIVVGAHGPYRVHILVLA